MIPSSISAHFTTYLIRAICNEDLIVERKQDKSVKIKNTCQKLLIRNLYANYILIESVIHNSQLIKRQLHFMISFIIMYCTNKIPELNELTCEAWAPRRSKQNKRENCTICWRKS